MSRTASHLPIMQYGVLPWRRTADGVEILLVTTRNTRRWIVPKGWPQDGCTPQQSAAVEAYEEAGVKGAVSEEAIGVFNHKKQMKSGDVVTCRIRVYAMEVNKIAADWPEKSEREAKWCLVAEAQTLVSDPSLRRIIVKFSRAAVAQQAA